MLFDCGTMKTTINGHISKTVIDLNVPQSNQPNNLKVTLLVENLASGQVAASVFEFPDCRVEAGTREQAITQIKTAFLERFKHIEAISWEIPVQYITESSEICGESTQKGKLLLDYSGILKDSPNFNEDPVEIQRKLRDEWS